MKKSRSFQADRIKIKENITEGIQWSSSVNQLFNQDNKNQSGNLGYTVSQYFLKRTGRVFVRINYLDHFLKKTSFFSGIPSARPVPSPFLTLQKYKNLLHFFHYTFSWSSFSSFSVVFWFCFPIIKNVPMVYINYAVPLLEHRIHTGPLWSG